MMTNSNSKLTARAIRFENCQVIFEDQNTKKDSPPAVSDTSETSIVSSSEESLCGDVQLKHGAQDLALQTNESERNQRKRTVSEGEEEQQLVRLLAQPDEDQAALPPLHTFIRQQIEVFTVERTDMNQRAPGRKNPIQMHQVGLRCIHCRSLPHRAKRAVCYPTSVARVYHAVSDMKFDHFSRCIALPEKVRAKLHELREDQKSSKEPCKKQKKQPRKALFISTAQYYHDSAISMGMTDRDGGVYLKHDASLLEGENRDNSWGATTCHIKNVPQKDDEPPRKRAKIAPFTPQSLCEAAVSNLLLRHQLNVQNRIINERPRMIQALSPSVLLRINLEADKVEATKLNSPPLSALEINQRVSPSTPNVGRKNGAILLSSHRDEKYLNDIHCFIRQQVEVFAAETSDVNAPAPGRRQRIVLGQVGIRCIHCAAVPVQYRLKRAVCYPPSMKGIYHAVSNMKFDHFTVCQSLPMNIKDQFEQLYSSEKRQSTRARATKGRSSPMGQFYVESATALGLVDTDTGIRFQSSQPDAVSATKKLHDMTGMSALLMAATDPLIREAYFQGKIVNTPPVKATATIPN